VLLRMCSEVLGPGWSPRLVCFSHAAPPAADLPIFNRLFRSPLQFDSELTAIIIDRADLDRPNPKADEQLARHARQLLDTVMNSGDRTVVQDVDQLIRLLMPAGRASIQNCAASMGMTVRTLQRMLDGAGTSFSSLLNEARMQLATQYLANPQMRITDIAGMLGYSSIGAFSRWHRSAFGAPARAMRP
ncbi:MAG TPA: helix-turn-helix domain-containing protein, partial [Novosphingobium sp.]|nr:helix-turn-helix domain-containing protein [Novosphingobium sp.]